MGKKLVDNVIDGLGNYVKNNVTTQHICTAEPADRAAAISTSLADVAVGSADITLADGDSNGRKWTVAAKNGVSVDASGTATHVALISATELLAVTTCTSKQIYSGDSVNIPAWKDEVADPT